MSMVLHIYILSKTILIYLYMYLNVYSLFHYIFAALYTQAEGEQHYSFLVSNQEAVGHSKRKVSG